jgi:signal transduction histidine kinase
MQHYPLWGAWNTQQYRHGIFVAAELFVLGTTLYLSAYMATGITTRLRERERSIVDLSEEIRRNAEALQTAYQRLREVEKMKSQYMRKVSHELRSPLSTIQSALKVVLEGLAGDLSDRSRDMVSRAERRARELISVTQDLLVLSRARDAKLAEQMEMVSLADIAASISEEMRPVAEEKSVSLALEVREGVPQMLADPEEMMQLVGNLVGNAIKYTPSGGSVSVSVGPEGGGARLEVADTGIGIPKEDLPKVFEEFYRTENARQHAAEGTGLGLSIVKVIADAHGAKVALDSEVGRGTRFTVVFPPRAQRRQNA